jgi:hypothetical protein
VNLVSYFGYYDPVKLEFSATSAVFYSCPVADHIEISEIVDIYARCAPGCPFCTIKEARVLMEA